MWLLEAGRTCLIFPVLRPISSNEAFYLPDFPEQVTVIGGGYIAVEFAGIFAGLGAKTTLLYRGEMFLRGFDDSIRSFMKEEIEKKGVELLFETEATHIHKTMVHCA